MGEPRHRRGGRRLGEAGRQAAGMGEDDAQRRQPDSARRRGAAAAASTASLMINTIRWCRASTSSRCGRCRPSRVTWAGRLLRQAVADCAAPGDGGRPRQQRPRDQRHRRHRDRLIDAAQFFLLGAPTVQVCTGAMPGKWWLRDHQRAQGRAGLSSAHRTNKFANPREFIDQPLLSASTTHHDLVERQKASRDAKEKARSQEQGDLAKDVDEDEGRYWQETPTLVTNC